MQCIGALVMFSRYVIENNIYFEVTVLVKNKSLHMMRLFAVSVLARSVTALAKNKLLDMMRLFAVSVHWRGLRTSVGEAS